MVTVLAGIMLHGGTTTPKLASLEEHPSLLQGTHPIPDLEKPNAEEACFLLPLVS